MTFEWEDITDELLEKVVCFSVNWTIGMGEPGDFEAITENGQIYYAELNSRSNSPKAIKLPNRFLGVHPNTSYEEQEIGKWRWVDAKYARIYIRKDQYDRIYPEIEKLGDQAWISGITSVKKLLDPQNKLPTLIFSETQAIRDKIKRERREYEEWKAKNRLVEGEDFEWKEFGSYDGSGFDCGYYLLLFKENDDGTISGSKWTIVCQREQFQEGSFKSNAPVEAYNLYYKRYENMGGILNYPNDGKRAGTEIYQYTTLTDHPYDYGRFHRTYFTLEEAKSAAMTRNEAIGWGNYYKTNLLKRNWSEMTVDEAKKDYFRAVKRAKELQLLFPRICSEVFRILSKYDTPGNAISEIAETLGLSENDVRIIWRFFPDCSLFTERGLSEAEKILTEAREFYDV
ncbi:MAG: hypothetical protein HDT43_06350 [Ruminococcaceae bacterium]|nr:hypothetical protein [Oscillospiraceae bacterium]